MRSRIHPLASVNCICDDHEPLGTRDALRFSYHSWSTIAVVTVVGELDLCTSPMVINAINELPGWVKEIVLDFSQLTFVDAAGLRAVSTGIRRVGMKNVSILDPSAPVTEVLLLVGLAPLIVG